MLILKNKILLNFFCLFIIFFCLAGPVFAYDFAKNSGIDETAGGKDGSGGAGFMIFDPEMLLIDKISIIIRAILSLVGVVFLILMIYGGYIWLTAQGNDQNVERARKIITNGLIGLVIVLIAYALSWFIFNLFGSQTLN